MGCGLSGTKHLSPIHSQDICISRSHFVKGSSGNIHAVYKLTTEIGAGAYSKVYEAIHKQTTVHRAVKVIPKNIMLAEAKAHFINEFNILKRTDHPNIVTLYEYFEDDRNFYLVQELCVGGELFSKLLERGKGFSEARAAGYIKQILSAVHHCHSLSIIHRDLKPENLLFETKHPNSMVKIIDFGLSCLADHSSKLREVAGTTCYMAPEVFGGQYNEKCDVWSVGVILFILLSAKMPFWGETDKELVGAIMQGRFNMDGPEWTEISQAPKALIMEMLKVDPVERPSAEQCFSNGWVHTSDERLKPRLLSHAIENMRNFRAETKLKRAVLVFIVSQLISKPELQELNQVFIFLDTTGDGRLGPKELQAGLSRATGTSLTLAEAESIIKEVDTNNNGFIDYSEFIMSAMPKATLLSKDRLKQAFLKFDPDQDGRISKNELKTLLMFNCDFVSEVDENGDGVIDFQEFEDMMLTGS